MANVDITLRVTNPSVFKQLETWSTTGMKVKIDLTPSFNAADFKKQVQTALGPIPVTIDPKLANPKQLARDIQAAIGGQVFNINVSIGNLAALNAQISSIFAGLGIQVGGSVPPQRQGIINTGTPLQKVYRTMAGIQGTLIANEQTPINNPSVAFLEQQLAAGASQGGIPGFFDQAVQARLARARETAQMRMRQMQALNRQFRENRLLEIGFDGPSQAAADFEELIGLRPGDINTSGINRFSFDLGRLKNVKAATSLGYTGLLGGPAGLLGGLIGGGLFGAGGVSPTSFLFQAVGNSISEKFEKLAAALKKASDAGLELEKNILGVQAILTTTSKVFRDGNEVNIKDALAFQRSRAEGLLRSTRGELSPLGINQGQQAAILRGVISGASEGGFNLNNAQTVRVAKILGGTTAVANEDLLQNIPRLVNNISDLLAGAPTAGRSELGQQFRRILPEIKAAQATGDTERLLRALEKYSDVIKTLELNTDSAAVAFRKYDAITQQLETTFGEAFNKALVPGLNAFNKALSNPALESSLTKVGESLGEITSAFIQLAATNLTGISNLFKDIALIGKGFDQINSLFGQDKASVTSRFSTNNPFLDFGLRFLEGESIFGKKTKSSQNKAVMEAANYYLGAGIEFRNNEDDIGVRYTRALKDIDVGSPDGAQLAKELDLYVKKERGEISEKVFNSQLLSSGKAFDRSRSLAGIDQGTRLGRFQAQQLGLQGQLDDGLINQDVFDAQSSRNSTLFGIQDQLAGINSQTVGGGLMSGLLGIKQRVVGGDITAGVGQEQSGKLFRDAIIKATEDFYTLTKSVQDASLALSEVPTKFKELGIQLDLAKKQQQDLAQSQYLNSLTGVDKALAMEEQLRAAGITPDITSQGKLSTLRGDGFDFFSGFDSPEDRRKKILQQQYIASVNELGLQPGKNELERLGAGTRVNELSLARSQAQPGGIQEKLAELSKNKGIMAIAEEFGLAKANEQFGVMEVDKAFRTLGKDATALIGKQGDGKDPAAAIRETFQSGASYYSGIKESFKAAMDEVFNG